MATKTKTKPVAKIAAEMGMSLLTPHITCRDCSKAIDFYKQAFGAEEVMRLPGPDGRLMHASIRINGSMLMMNDEFPEMGGASPLALGNSPVTLHLMVDDADAAAAKAVAAGADIVMPVADQFWGDRYGVVKDPFGHLWSIATPVWPPKSAEEMAAAQAAAMGQMTSVSSLKYVDGFLVAAPTRNKQAYFDMAASAWPFFKKHGAVTMVEGWGDDVPEGKINSMRSAVLLKPDETALFSWVTWPDKATRDAGMAAMMTDPDMKAPPEMPFDGQRMIFAGFDVLLGDPAQPAGYIDGTVIPVPVSRRADYTAASAAMAGLFKEHGAVSVVDCWGEDVPEGKVNSFHTAVLRKPDEGVVFSWIGWKDKAARDAGWAALMQDPRMEQHGPKSVGADMSRMIFGGYEPMVFG